MLVGKGSGTWERYGSHIGETTIRMSKDNQKIFSREVYFTSDLLANSTSSSSKIKVVIFVLKSRNQSWKITKIILYRGLILWWKGIGSKVGECSGAVGTNRGRPRILDLAHRYEAWVLDDPLQAFKMAAVSNHVHN